MDVKHGLVGLGAFLLPSCFYAFSEINLEDTDCKMIFNKEKVVVIKDATLTKEECKRNQQWMICIVSTEDGTLYDMEKNHPITLHIN